MLHRLCYAVRRILHPKRCPHCGFSYYWQDSSPGTCDGCGYPTTHNEE